MRWNVRRLMRSCTRRPEDCRKRLFDSERAARDATVTASFRVRVYSASECCGRWGYHVTNGDKRHWDRDTNRAATRIYHRAHDIAPVRTLAECEALASEMRARG